MTLVPAPVVTNKSHCPKFASVLSMVPGMRGSICEYICCVAHAAVKFASFRLPNAHTQRGSGELSLCTNDGGVAHSRGSATEFRKRIISDKLAMKATAQNNKSDVFDHCIICYSRGLKKRCDGFCMIPDLFQSKEWLKF